MPTRRDFLSHRDPGKPLLDPAFEREWAEGISVFASLERAAVRARSARRKLGRRAMLLQLADDSSVVVVQTTRDRWRFTMYGRVWPRRRVHTARRPFPDRAGRRRTLSVVCDLFDLDDGNLAGSCQSEAEAMHVVRVALREHGRTVASAPSLIRIDDDDGSESVIADGDDLVRRAEPTRTTAPATHVA